MSACDALRALLERVSATPEDRHELELAAAALDSGFPRRVAQALRRAAVLAEGLDWEEGFRGAADDLEHKQAVYAAEQDIRAEVARAVN